MNDTKPFYTSKTLWSAFLAFIFAAADAAGIGITAEDALVINEAIDKIITAVLSLFAVYGRIVAYKQIGV